MIVDLQLNQGSAPWPVLRDCAHAAEHAGFSTLWNLDHFSGEMFAVDSMPECFSSLAALAAITSRIGLGTLVANVNNREPGLLANAASTVQEVSGGRFTLGVGAGASPTSPFASEQRALGMGILPTMAARHARLFEVVDAVREIWSPERDDKFRGFPRPVPAPRIIAGINSAALARLAGARLDGVNVRFDHPERGHLISLAREATAHSDRFDTSVWAWFEPALVDPSHPFQVQLAAEGVRRLILVIRGVPDPATISAASRYFV